MKHGHARKGQVTKTYVCWTSMVERCTTPSCTVYPFYGGRGIGVCVRWDSFENFLADMGEVPEGHTLERINNDDDYCPGNCRWATRTEQANNRRSTRYVEFRGRRQSVAEWAREFGLNYHAFYSRLERMGEEQAMLRSSCASGDQAL
jgi:hypothetical protein